MLLSCAGISAFAKAAIKIKVIQTLKNVWFLEHNKKTGKLSWTISKISKY